MCIRDKFWVLYNGIAVLNADGIIEPPDRAGAAPKVSEFPVTVQIDRVPDDVIMDMGFVDMGTDHKSVIALGKPLSLIHIYGQGSGNCSGVVAVCGKGKVHACLRVLCQPFQLRHNISIGAVSYTHLDVYKRQQMLCHRDVDRSHLSAYSNAFQSSCEFFIIHIIL